VREASVGQPPGGEPRAPAVEERDPEAEAQAFAEEIAKAPAADWVLNVAVTLANVAAAKIDGASPEEARLVIDALAGIVDAVGERLGDSEPALRQTVAQLRLAFAARAGGASGQD
jgi:hypothetical protein